MKKIIIALLSVAYFCSCSQTAQNSKEKETNDLELAYKRAASSTIYEDTIYLGFRFGMTEKEVNKHFDKLVKSKKVYVEDYTNKYRHIINFQGMEIKYGFAFEYFENKLIRLKMYGDRDAIFTMKLFQEAKPGYKLGIYTDLLGDKTYIQQKNNVVVLFSGDIITYEDGKILPKYNEYLLKQDSIKKAESLSNF